MIDIFSYIPSYAYSGPTCPPWPSMQWVTEPWPPWPSPFPPTGPINHTPPEPNYYQQHPYKSAACGILLSLEDKARMDKLSREAFTLVNEMQEIVSHYLRQNPRAKHANFSFTRLTEKHGSQGYDRIVFSRENPDGGVPPEPEDGYSCGIYNDPPGICLPC